MKSRQKTRPLGLSANQRPPMTLPWYLKNDLPSKEMLHLRHQVRSLLDKNISNSSEIENFIVQARKKKPQRRRRSKPPTSVFQSKTRQYEKLFTTEGVSIRNEPAVPPSALEAVSEVFKHNSRLQKMYSQSKDDARAAQDKSFRSACSLA